MYVSEADGCLEGVGLSAQWLNVETVCSAFCLRGELRKMLVSKATNLTETNHSELVNGSRLTAKLGLPQKAHGAHHVHLRLEVLEQQPHTMTDGMWSVSTWLAHLD